MKENKGRKEDKPTYKSNKICTGYICGKLQNSNESNERRPK